MAIPKACKRLAEVDFPIAAVSAHAVREKSIRHGHPSTLHLWWARRPLGACRAVLLGLLLPDPADPLCPVEFKARARELLPKALEAGEGDLGLRQSLLKFIGNFANWDLASNAVYLEVARGLVQAAHPEETPLVVDPFAGGGSIPLEALRLGCEAFASDLNPVAGLILKVMLEDIPRHGPGLADELRRVGAEIRQAVQQELAEFYPVDPDGAKPIAYLWARTVRCETPDCGAEIPLVRSFWLSKKANRRRALRYRVVRATGQPPQIEFEIFQPDNDRDVPDSTVSRANATCLCCGKVLPSVRVRAQISAQRGGPDVVFDMQGQRAGGARLLATVVLKPGDPGRSYRLPNSMDYEAIWEATKRLEQEEPLLSDGLSLVPTEATPAGGGAGAGRAFSIQKYGMMTFGDLFTTRQKLALSVLARSVARLKPETGVKDLLALVVDRVSSRGSSLCLWRYQADQEKVEHVFGRQALPVVWDFAEAVLTSESTGSFSDGVSVVAQAVQAMGGIFQTSGQAQLADALHSPLPDEVAGVWFTDPPYYDAVPYSDLSDYFFVWLKRTLPSHPLLRDLTDPANALTPKVREIVQDEVKQVDGRPKDRAFFEETIGQAFAEGRRTLTPDGVGCVVFAHKTTEGWEALLAGMIRGGWTITGSWPIATEMKNRLRARDSAALATSIHLICRPRPEDAPIGDWADVLRELPRRVTEWMDRLQGEGVRGADLVFACIGPALEIFSRYRRVETAEGQEIDLPKYLNKVWEVVGRAALEQILGAAESRAHNGAAAVLEEDARLTALFLWTLQSSSGEGETHVAGREEEIDEEELDAEVKDQGARKKPKGYSLIYDVARRFAQPLGIHLPDWEGRIVDTDKGVVRLLAVSERAGQLFGDEGAQAVASQIERSPAGAVQLSLFPDAQRDAPRVRGRRGRTAGASLPDEELSVGREATTLDRVHAAMLLQKAGRTQALRALLEAEQERGPAFLRLANALSALYPRGSEEKRLLDAMLLAGPR